MAGPTVATPSVRTTAPRWSSWTRSELRRLPAAIAVYRAGLALVAGDPAGTVTHARRALDLAGEDDHLGAGRAAALLGLASLDERRPRGGHRAYAEAMAQPASGPGTSPTSSGCAIALADIRIAQGRLREAMRTYEQALQLRRATAGPGPAGHRGHARRA